MACLESCRSPVSGHTSFMMQLMQTCDLLSPLALVRCLVQCIHHLGGPPCIGPNGYSRLPALHLELILHQAGTTWLQAPPDKQTPLWYGPDKAHRDDPPADASKNAAAPPSFRGVGEYTVGSLLMTLLVFHLACTAQRPPGPIRGTPSNSLLHLFRLLGTSNHSVIARMVWAVC